MFITFFTTGFGVAIIALIGIKKYIHYKQLKPLHGSWYLACVLLGVAFIVIATCLMERGLTNLRNKLLFTLSIATCVFSVTTAVGLYTRYEWWLIAFAIYIAITSILVAIDKIFINQ